MARPYASEMAKLRDTFEWAVGVDIGPLRQAVRTASYSSLRAIGSGGSLTAAHAMASLHQCFTGQLAAVSTPLEAVAEPLGGDTSIWLLSAGGGNVDILSAFRNLVEREPRQLSLLCGRNDSPLVQLGRAHPFTDLLLYPTPAGKDGFLATNSLLAFVTVLCRAYVEVRERPPSDWLDARDRIFHLLDDEGQAVDGWREALDPIWPRATTVVLYGPNTRVGAIDLESKFTEAALGNLQLADYRNFAHGRHHWMAKRGADTAVIAFLSDEDRRLAERTLALVPPDVPQARLDFEGAPISAMIGSLVAALRITGWAGEARGIDPGRPGVPEFGRRLYNLPLPKARVRNPASLKPREVAAIRRKAGVDVAALQERGHLDEWRTALAAFRRRLLETPFQGVVFDYDGTLVDARRRRDPPTADIAAELIRIAEGGARIAIATGRGASVRRDLQTILPHALWSRILIGYYNGAEIAPLEDDAAPDGRDTVCSALEDLAKALRENPELAQAVDQTDRPHQITLETKRSIPEGRLWDLAQQVLLTFPGRGIRVTRSSHSIDIVAEGVSKLSVSRHLQEAHGEMSLLAIGDRGRWPGNDYELLQGPFSLSVDEVSVDPAACWNLGRPGQRGTAVTLDYLRALQLAPAGLVFGKAAFR